MTAAFSIHALSAGYGSNAVLHDISFPEMVPGNVVAVVGPNAAGKSTLMKVLAGLLPGSGEAISHGDELLGMEADARARRVGYLPQSLPGGTGLLAYECVLGACRAAGQSGSDPRIQTIFHLLGLEDVALRPLSELSGGKRQLVGLAQVLVREPGLLLLDEPTSALDLRWQIDVLRIVGETVRRTGAVALVCVHDINLAMRFCDMVAVLSNGRLIASGAPCEAITPDILRLGWGVEARIERCSQGFPIAIADRSIHDEKVVPLNARTSRKKNNSSQVKNREEK